MSQRDTPVARVLANDLLTLLAYEHQRAYDESVEARPYRGGQPDTHGGIE